MSIRESTNGFVLNPGEGRQIWFLSALLTWKAVAANTDGQFELVEQRGPHGFGAPVHLHKREAEAFYVLEGELTVILGDERVVASAGSFVYVPRNTRHAFVVESPEAKFLTLIIPPGLEAFMGELSEPATSSTLPAPPAGPPNLERFDAVAAKHGQQTFGPPPSPRS